MKILIFGDIYGRIWRKAFEKEFSILKDTYAPDFTIANIENITSGRGPIAQHAKFIEDCWVDLMTLWDHSFDNMPNIKEYFSLNNGKIIRPANFYESTNFSLPGNGFQVIKSNGKRLLVIQLLWEVFISHKVENPFIIVERMLASIPENSYDACIVEFHRETTAELYGMAHHLSWKVWLVYGTHTHVQTNDAHILWEYTGVLTDVGMNGPANSVIWADFLSVKPRFLTGIQKWKIEQSLDAEYVIGALYCEIDDKTGACLHIENIFKRGKL